jgi:hypothetical protein
MFSRWRKSHVDSISLNLKLENGRSWATSCWQAEEALVQREAHQAPDWPPLVRPAGRFYTAVDISSWQGAICTSFNLNYSTAPLYASAKLGNRKIYLDLKLQSHELFFLPLVRSRSTLVSDYRFARCWNTSKLIQLCHLQSWVELVFHGRNPNVLNLATMVKPSMVIKFNQ